MRCVIDTNILVSHLLFPNSLPSRVVGIVRRGGILLLSSSLLDELSTVLRREKFDRYLARERREAFLTDIAAIAQLVTVHQRVVVCRDPKDDRVLEVAVNGQAACIVTGDQDLLTLESYEGIAILTPVQFQERYGAD